MSNTSWKKRGNDHADATESDGRPGCCGVRLPAVAESFAGLSPCVTKAFADVDVGHATLFPAYMTAGMRQTKCFVIYDSQYPLYVRYPG